MTLIYFLIFILNQNFPVKTAADINSLFVKQIVLLFICMSAHETRKYVHYSNRNTQVRNGKIDLLYGIAIVHRVPAVISFVVPIQHNKK